MTVENTANWVTPSADWTAYEVALLAPPPPGRSAVPQRWQNAATSGLADEHVGHATSITPQDPVPSAQG